MNQPPEQSLLIIGYGHLGRRVAQLAVQAGWSVYATSRRPEKRAEMQSAGVHAIAFDITQPATARNLPHAAKWLWCPAFDRSQGLPVYDVVVGGLQHALEHAPKAPEQVVFTSTTSVYHQSAGEWVDENSATEPVTPSGQASLAAELLLHAWARTEHRNATVLRLSGLYGPGRWIRRASVEAGEPIACLPDTWLNLVHTADAATACLQALKLNEPGTYCITDNRPILRREFYETSAQLLNAPPPRFIAPTSPDFAGNKRVNNRLATEKLGWKPAYSDINSGLSEGMIG